MNKLHVADRCAGRSLRCFEARNRASLTNSCAAVLIPDNDKRLIPPTTTSAGHYRNSAVLENNRIEAGVQNLSRSHLAFLLDARSPSESEPR